MQAMSLLQAHMTAFAAGFLLDLLIGDPHSLPHPVRWIGKVIDFLDKRLLGKIPPEKTDPDTRDKASERRKGFVMVMIVIAVTLIVSAAVMLAAYRVSALCGMIVESILTCSVLAATSLRRESMKVYDELIRGNLEGAKKAVSMIVGRDTDCLDGKGITKAAVETVAENLSDGEIAPMLYTALGGPVLGLIYKAVNTMDSMTGYKNDRYMWFGSAAAKLDDLVNYIPSRISAFLIMFSAAILGREYDAGRSYRIWKRDRYKHKSPNAAQTESACAGALGVRLAGDAQYFGRLESKPTIGDDIRPIETEDIRRANRLMMTSSVLGELICLTIMLLISIL